jgi:hypothetical protein
MHEQMRRLSIRIACNAPMPQSRAAIKDGAASAEMSANHRGNVRTKMRRGRPLNQNMPLRLIKCFLVGSHDAKRLY